MPLNISPDRDDKFAFLFAGGTNPLIDCNKDVQNMYETLTTYYNYLPGNIHVYYGGAAAPVVPGATPVTDLAGFQTAFSTFATAATGGIGLLPAKKGIIFLYFTGIGTSGSYTITGSVTIIPADLETMINIFNDSDSYYLHVFMQQDFGRSFQGMSFAPEGAGIFPCLGANTGSTSGSDFTLAFTRALQFSFNGTLYADEQDPGETIADIEPYHISLAQAAVHAGGVMDYEYLARPLTGSPHYLGTPKFLVRDGSPSWWESPDIYLTHSAADTQAIVDAFLNPLDYYVHRLSDIHGKYNFVNVTTRNFGTHPVRFLQTGVKIFESGPSGSEPVQIKDNELKVGSVQNVLIPIPDPDAASFPAAPGGDLVYESTTTWSALDPLEFPLATHRCVRAKVGLQVSLADLNDWANLLSADYRNEAQRNLDVFSLSERRSEYQLFNPFRHPVELIMPVPAVLEEMQKVLKYSIKEFRGKDWTPVEPKIRKKTEYLRFKLEPGETRKFRLKFSILKEVEGRKEIRIPFEFLIKPEIKGSKFREHKFSDFKDLKSFGGFTLLVRSNHADVNGVVQDPKGKGLAGIPVNLHSADRSREWSVSTAENGSFRLEDIPTGLYGIVAGKGKKQSFPVDIFVTKKNEKNKVKIVIY
jgi:hypothetical protein